MLGGGDDDDDDDDDEDDGDDEDFGGGEGAGRGKARAAGGSVTGRAVGRDGRFEALPLSHGERLRGLRSCPRHAAVDGILRLHPQ
jgi:hypothetical protein